MNVDILKIASRVADGVKLEADPRERYRLVRLLDAHIASTDQTKRMAGEQGFEPWYAGIKIQCLNQLGDSPTQLAACRTSYAF